METIDAPATLGRHLGRTVVEVFVVGLQETILDAISLEVGSGVSAKKYLVGMLQDETTGTVGLAAELADTGADVDVVIGAAIQQPAKPGQVLGVATHMGADKGSLRPSRYPNRRRFRRPPGPRLPATGLPAADPIHRQRVQPNDCGIRRPENGAPAPRSSW